MANRKRSQETINFQKQQMSKAALEIIINDGYKNLSIRKLSKSLQISPTTIYNYFKSRDEIYVYVLNYGFEMLYDEFRKAYDSHTAPVDRLKALCENFIAFSVRERDLTFIMLILDTPKYNDYIGTGLEPIMKIELQNALKCRDIIMQIVTEIAEGDPLFPAESIPYCTFSIIYRMIGFATVSSNNLINYLAGDIDGLAVKAVNEILDRFRRDK